MQSVAGSGLILAGQSQRIDIIEGLREQIPGSIIQAVPNSLPGTPHPKIILRKAYGRDPRGEAKFKGEKH
jgi:hypothetical protein